MKKCSICKEIKPLEDFRRGRICRDCERKKNNINSKKYNEESKNRVKGNFVYRLIHNNEIIYIGKSTQINVRLTHHLRDKDFDTVEVIQFDNEVDMCISEIYFINKYRPRLNKEFIYSDAKSMSLKELDSILWINIDYYYTNYLNNYMIYLNNYTINLNNENNENEIERLMIQKLDVNFGPVRLCFMRERNGRFYVYVQNKSKKQKSLKIFENKNDAEKLVEDVRNYIKKYFI